MASHFNLDSDDVWHPVGPVTLFRLLPPGATYSPTEPWPGAGRFDDGDVPTLYLSRSPDGAVAEYLRRHPEFLGFQGRLKHELYQVAFDGVDDGADVRTPPQADAVGIPFERLRSSDAKNSVRYAECRDLARATAEKPGRSIEYPSAALENAQNVVGLGLNGWTAALEDSLPLPTVAEDSVRVLPDGAEP